MIGLDLTYAPISDFRLGWRFFEDPVKYAVLNTEDRKNFKLISRDSSRKLWRQFMKSSEPLVPLKTGDWPWSEMSSENVLLSEQPDDTFVEHGRTQLQSDIHLPEDAQLIFFWHPDEAVETVWRVFVKHWDDFCYPSDELNVAVFPSSDSLLLYSEEQFWFLRGR